MQLTEEHFGELKRAKQILENPGLAAKITNLIGKPIEVGMKLLPDKASEIISDITNKSLKYALETALLTMDKNDQSESSNYWHKLSVAITGGVGGYFGFLGLAVELPISTTIMLRSIADIARSEGANFQQPIVKIACVEVFALGGPSSQDDASESGYYAVRIALAKAVTDAAEYIAEREIAKEGAPALVRLISAVSSRFGIVVTEKMAAQAIPVIGAAAGAAINLAFIDHFQDMARGHFIVRRLESIYNAAFIKEEYDKIPLD